MKNKLLSIIAFVLSLIILSTVFVGCGDGNTPDGENSDSDVAGDLVPVGNPQYKNNIAKGRFYRKSVDTESDYPDSYKSELTDGKTAFSEPSDLNDKNYSGYSGNEEILITIDLEDTHDKIYEIRFGYLSSNKNGVTPPASATVLTSLDGRNFTEAGKMNIPEFKEGCRLEAVYTSEYFINTRFIRLAISHNGLCLIDEIEIYADEQKKYSDNEKFLELVKDAYNELGTVKYQGGETADASCDALLTSYGAPYTLSQESDASYKDNGLYITDGKITGDSESGNWVGFAGGKDIEIVIDLGSVRNDLSEFRLMCCSDNKSENYMPVAVTYSVSDDNKSYTDVGRIFGTASGQSTYDFPLFLDKCASGRYVKFTLANTHSKLILVEEAAVYAYSNAGISDSFYGPIIFDTEKKEWPEPSDETVNLIAGIIQQTYIPADVVIPAPDNLSPGDLAVLTDGVKTLNTPDGIDIHNGKYYKCMSSATHIDFYFDLGATSAVKSFTAQFTNKTAWGVYAPYKLNIYISEDAENWYSAGVVDVKPESDSCVVSAELNLEKAVTARFVCFGVSTFDWVGVSELEVFGTTSVENAIPLAESGFVKIGENNVGYLAPDEEILKGASDLCLLYHGTEVDPFTTEKLLPYLAYIDSDGNIKDTMFDSFLFLLSGPFPSGNKTTEPASKSDLEWILDDIFTKNENIYALNEVAGQVKEALSLGDDFKFGITIALYQPPSADDTADLVWYMKEFEKRFAESDFRNLEIIGYYWYSEGVYRKGDAIAEVQNVSKLVHQCGYDLFWIPWFCAPGYEDWENFGFDVVCMQPSYVFNNSIPLGRIERAADLFKRYGFCIEIEICYDALSEAEFTQRYLEYLYGGIKYGYMKDCIHMYYQEIFIFYNAAMSKNASTRKVYDATYQFIKGTLELEPIVLDDVKYECANDTPLVDTLSLKEAKNSQYVLCDSPSAGSITLADNGSFIYLPEKGFTGEVTFSYIYISEQGISDICTCIITVK